MLHPETSKPEIAEVETLEVFCYLEFSLILIFSHGFLQKILVDIPESQVV